MPEVPEFLPAIRRARIGQLSIYEVSEAELSLLERGSPDSVLLNFAIFFVSSALSLLVALLTSTASSTHAFIVLVIMTIVGFAAGVVLLGIWFWYRRSRATILSEIRKRMPAEGLAIEADGLASKQVDLSP